MADETRGRKPKAINDLIRSEIMEFRDQIVLKKNTRRPPPMMIDQLVLAVQCIGRTALLVG
ncbi:hypothetical protein QTP88_025751 [Uroleucon formosanum]